MAAAGAVRIPLIPGFNDGEENIRDTARFVAAHGLRQIDLLPFNDLAAAKYREIGAKWKYEGVGRQPDTILKALSDVVSSFGLSVTIGGLW